MPATASQRGEVNHLGAVTAVNHRRLAAGVGGREGQVLHLRPLAAAREAGEQPESRRQDTAVIGVAGAVGGMHGAAHDVAGRKRHVLADAASACPKPGRPWYTPP